MPDIYPYITENQSLGINEVAGYVNQVTNNLFFPIILLIIFVVSFVTTMHFGNGRAWVFASFFCSILAIFMVIANWLNPAWMYLLFVMTAAGLLILRLAKSSNYPQI